MPTPYTRTEAPPAPGARPRLEAAARRALARWGRVGIAEHLSDAGRIRWAFVIRGPRWGLPAYLFLWAVTPESRTVTALDPASGAPRRSSGVAGLQRSRQGALVATGVLSPQLVRSSPYGRSGLDVRASLLVPLLLVAAGAVVIVE